MTNAFFRYTSFCKFCYILNLTSTVVYYHMVTFLDAEGRSRRFWRSQKLIINRTDTTTFNISYPSFHEGRWRGHRKQRQLGFNLCRRVDFQMLELNYSTTLESLYFIKSTEIKWHKRLSKNNRAFKIVNIFSDIFKSIDD